MKKIFTLLAAAALATSANAEVTTVDVTITWPMAKAVETVNDETGDVSTSYENDLDAVVSDGLADCFTLSEPALGEYMSWGKPRKTSSDEYNMIEALVQPAEQVKTPTDGHSITFTVTPKSGYTFQATGLQFLANVIGTNGGNYDLSYKVGDFSDTLEENYHPNRNNEDGGYFSECIYSLNAPDSSDPVDVTFMIYNLGNNKQMGFSNVVISGKLTGESVQSGVANIAVDENAPVEYFNLQGVRVANPENGLYIRRQGANASKVFVK